jgi:hypothetical protein
MLVHYRQDLEVSLQNRTRVPVAMVTMLECVKI